MSDEEEKKNFGFRTEEGGIDWTLVVMVAVEILLILWVALGYLGVVPLF